MFELRGVAKRYGKTTALHSTQLIVPEGRTTALIGPSGCGKSSLLRLMMGLLSADEGQVLFGGVPITEDSGPEVRRRLGYVTQGGGLFPHLTAEANATVVARTLGKRSFEIEQRLDMLCELTQFPREGLRRYPAQLSGGQVQRVSLMRALMLDPDVLLLDEPLGALDPMMRFELQEDLRRIFSRLSKTVVLVTHDLSEAAYLGDEIVLMREGKVVQVGALEALVRHPVDPFVTRFIHAQRAPLEALEQRT